MKFNEKRKINLYVLFINIILCLFIYSSYDDKNIVIILSTISSFVAIIFSYKFIKVSKKRILNILGFTFNVLLTNVILFYTLYNAIN